MGHCPTGRLGKEYYTVKDFKTYQILCWVNLACPIGLNRLYLGTGGFWRLVTLDYIYIGAIASLFYQRKAFDEAMAKRGYVNTSRRP